MKRRAATTRVLCIDDDVHVLAFMKEMLDGEGFEVQTAVDGAHGLQKIATSDRPYDVLIVDARMPHLDGWRFIMQARAGGYAGKVIVFSAYLDADELQRYRDLNVDALVEKPPQRGEILTTIKRLAA